MAVRTTIYARSPYLIKVAEPTQVGAKVELYIWRVGEIEPFSPTKVLSGKIPSTDKRELIFNISPYIREYITSVHQIIEDYDVAYVSDANHCFIRVKRYTQTPTGYTLLTNQVYNAVNGWTEYLNGVNGVPSFTQTYYPYTNEAIKPLYNIYNEFIIDANIVGFSGLPFLIETNNSGIEYTIEIGDYVYVLPSSTQIPDSLYFIVPFPYYTEGTFTAILRKNGTFLGNIGKITYTTQCKYKPISISFVNQWGGIEWMSFIGNNQRSFDVKSTDFKPYNRLLSPNTTSVSYNYITGQSKDYNINGTKSIKLNTGWVPETYDRRIYQLLHSESINIHDEFSNFQPVTIKTKNIKIQKHITEKLINYEVEFDYAFNNINNVI